MKRLLTIVLLGTAALAATAAMAATEEIVLTIENHAFTPKEVKIPAGKKVKLRIVNKDATPAEFESKPLSREKVIPGKSSAIVNVGPLKAGRYAFVEEYHENEPAAQGTIIVE